jgi:signal transduction histidine kinase
MCVRGTIFHMFGQIKRVERLCYAHPMARARPNSSSMPASTVGVPDVEAAGSYPELLSLAVHELRGPLSIVTGYLRMLPRDIDPTLRDRQQKMIEEIEKSCARLVAIIKEISEVAKLDAGIVTFERRPTDAFALVAEVAGLVHEAEDRDVRFEARGLADGAPLLGDANQLRRAFAAIFQVVAREKPRQCTVVAERRIEEIDGRSSAIVIVAEEASVQVAYDREPGNLHEERGGIGMALPFARRVIEGHGGRVWAPSPAGGAANWGTDSIARGSAIISLPLTELSR